MSLTSASRYGHPFLAFLNTVEDDGKHRHENTFEDTAELVRLLKQAGISAGDAPLNRTQTSQILALRETAYAALSALAAGRPPGREEALSLETSMKAVLRDAQFIFGSNGLRIQPGPLAGLYDHLILSLADLMRRPDLDRLRECQRCTHLFLDHGRGRGRRWCAMERCGNRAKAESFRARRRAKSA